MTGIGSAHAPAFRYGVSASNDSTNDSGRGAAEVFEQHVEMCVAWIEAIDARSER